ncbi:MAG: hypothetical protein LC775_12340, partial [Acidobacteria bacterium]|nr:hypothetical protein [Acidobacteriota bacterium]
MRTTQYGELDHGALLPTCLARHGAARVDAERNAAGSVVQAAGGPAGRVLEAVPLRSEPPAAGVG